MERRGKDKILFSNLRELNEYYRMLCASRETGWLRPDFPRVFFSLTWRGQIFQNLIVSSAATLATLLPSGDETRSRTRLVCPFRSAT